MLASMAERGQINERAFGKQKIYFAKQVWERTFSSATTHLLSWGYYPRQTDLEKLSRDELEAMDNVGAAALLVP